MRVWREVPTPWWRVPAAVFADVRKVGFGEWLWWQRLGRGDCPMCEVYATEIAEVTAENVQLRGIVEAARRLRFADWHTEIRAAEVNTELWHDLVDAVDALDARASDRGLVGAQPDTVSQGSAPRKEREDAR